MKHTDNILTGGDGVTGQYGLEVRTRINNQFAVVMGNTEYLPSTFVFTTLNLSPFANKVIEIAFQHDLSGANFTLPNNCTLYFNGGALLNAGTITGSDTKILNPKNLQIFSLATVFAGTWNQVQGCVQWFGGISNQSILTYANDIMIPLAALLATRWGVFWLHGNYYVGSTLQIIYPIEMHLGGTARPDNVLVQKPGGGWTTTPPSLPSEVTRFYSNLDINWFQIRAPFVKILGGIFDNTGTTLWNHAMIYMHADDTIEHTAFRQTVIGSKTNVRTEGQTGGYFRYDTAGATLASHFYKTYIDSDIYYQPIGIQIDSYVAGNHPNAWSNTHNINGLIFGCKKAIVHNMASWANISVVTQTHDCLAESERDFYTIEYSGYPVIADIFCWDLTGNKIGDYYVPRMPINAKTYGTILMGSSILSNRLGQFHGINPISSNTVDMSTKTLLLKDTYGGNTFISELHSPLVDWNLKTGNAITVKGKQGTGFNFDTQLENDTAPDNSGIVINNILNLASSVGTTNNLPMNYGFDATTNLDVDFVEITLTGSQMRFLNYYLSYYSYQNSIKEFQFIGTKEDSSYFVVRDTIAEKRLPARYYIDVLSNLTIFNKVVIRLIGLIARNQMYILDLAGKSGENPINYIPKINDYRGKWSGLITQTGTNNPVIQETLNTLRKSITSIRNNIGTYYLNSDYTLPIDRTDPIDETAHVYEGITFIGTIRIQRDNSSRFLIQTWNSTGVLADGILTNQHISFNVGW